MDTRIVWAAGFFDGEGSVQITKTHPAISISVTQASRLCLETYVSLWGGRIYSFKNKGMRRTYYRWIANGSWAAKALQDMRPFLLVKSYQARIAIEFEATSQRGTPVSPELRARREEWRQELARDKAA